MKCFLLQRFEGLMLKKQVSPLPFHILSSPKVVGSMEINSVSLQRVYTYVKTSSPFLPDAPDVC